VSGLTRTKLLGRAKRWTCRVPHRLRSSRSSVREGALHLGANCREDGRAHPPRDLNMERPGSLGWGASDQQAGSRHAGAGDYHGNAILPVRDAKREKGLKDSVLGPSWGLTRAVAGASVNHSSSPG
jgi:hypothetical protein